MTRMHADNALEWSSMVEFPLTPEQVRAAAVTVCANARDRAEAAELLAMLGLVPDAPA